MGKYRLKRTIAERSGDVSTWYIQRGNQSIIAVGLIKHKSATSHRKRLLLSGNKS